MKSIDLPVKRWGKRLKVRDMSKRVKEKEREKNTAL